MGKFLNQIRKKLGLDPQRDMTLTGKIPNEVVISRATQNESVDPTAPGNRPVVLAPARMNPPTVGHGVLMKQVYDTAQKYNAPHHVILTRTHDVPKKKTGADVKNPLTPEQKVMHAKRFFPGMNIHAASPDKPNLLSQASDLHRQGHNHLIVVAGSDRVPEYQKLLNTYNGQEGKHGYYNFKKITVVPAGAERDPNATGAAAVSGTSSRKAAESGDFDAWRKSTVPSHVTDTEAKQLFHHLRSGMGVKDTVSEASEGFPVQAIPTATARDRLGAKSPLNNLPPPGDAGDIGKDSNLKGKQQKNFQLMRRRDQKRSSAYLEGYDEVGGMDPINGGNRSAVFAPTTSPITTSRIAPKKIKEGLFAADIANGDTGESGSANQSMEGIPVTAKEKTKSKEFNPVREEKRGLWDNIHAKQKRIKNGSGERMRKPGSEGAPTAAALKASQNEETELGENAFNQLGQTKIVGNMLPTPAKGSVPKHGKKFQEGDLVVPHTGPYAGEVHKVIHSLSGHVRMVHPSGHHYDTIAVRAKHEHLSPASKKQSTKYNAAHDAMIARVRALKEGAKTEMMLERGEDKKGYFRSTESGAGITRKGAKAMGIKTAVTTPPSKLDPKGKAAARRRSFCARMGGMKGPMKDEKGRPTRKAMSLRRWNCEQVELVEAHKIGTKVTIHKGQGAGITGRIGEIRRKFKGDTNPSYTIFHGENDAIRVNKSQIKAVNEQSLTDKVKAIMEGKK